MFAALREVAFAIGVVVLAVALIGPIYSDAFGPAIGRATGIDPAIAFELVVAVVVLVIHILWRVKRSRRRKAARE